jgi:hypothetical protein
LGGGWGVWLGVHLRDLEAAIDTITFPEILHDADQAGTGEGESVRGGAGLELVVISG